MASHPEQIRLQIKDAIDAGLSSALGNYDRDPHMEDFDVELMDLVQGKGSSHYIAIFQFTDHWSFTNQDRYNILNDLRSEILDEVASTISRKRIPNITFKVATALGP
jgi:hypothetical protein